MKHSPEPSSERSDATLVHLASGGEVAAFHELVDRHADRLFRIALCIAPTCADAEDLLQETLLGAFRSLGTFSGKSSVKTWLISILKRQAPRGWRGLRNRQKFRSIPAPNDEAAGDASRLTVASASAACDFQMDLISVLKQLPPDRREIIVLREFDGLSYDEIAEALSIPRGTVESRLYRARADLRELLIDYAPEDEDHAIL